VIEVVEQLGSEILLDMKVGDQLLGHQPAFRSPTRLGSALAAPVIR
jgi:hypothetical protein